MTKKKRQFPDIEEILERPWCYYCERDFDDLKILISHQKAKHFKCERCNRRLNTAGGLCVHMTQVHKESLNAVDNALPNRTDTNIEIFGMEGIPEEIMSAHHQRITEVYFRREAEMRAKSGNSGPGAQNKIGEGGAKQRKIETPEELKKRLAEHKARKAAGLPPAGSETNTPAAGSEGAGEVSTDQKPIHMSTDQAPNNISTTDQASNNISTDQAPNNISTDQNPIYFLVNHGFRRSHQGGGDPVFARLHTRPMPEPMPTVYKQQVTGNSPQTAPFQQTPYGAPPSSSPPAGFNPYEAPPPPPPSDAYFNAAAGGRFGAPPSGMQMNQPKCSSVHAPREYQQFQPPSQQQWSPPASSTQAFPPPNMSHGLPQPSPGLPQRPAFNPPNLSKEDMTKLHDVMADVPPGVPNMPRQVSQPVQAALQRPTNSFGGPGAFGRQSQPPRQELSRQEIGDSIDELITSITSAQQPSAKKIKFEKADGSGQVVSEVAGPAEPSMMNEPKIKSEPRDEAESTIDRGFNERPPPGSNINTLATDPMFSPDKWPRGVLNPDLYRTPTSAAIETNTNLTPATSTPADAATSLPESTDKNEKKKAKKDKREKKGDLARLTYSDNITSPEEKRAGYAKYGFDRTANATTEFVRGSVGEETGAVTGATQETVRDPQD